ncbi:malate:quinone oxidoreductase [Prochlorococcus marinus]|uniref:Probable malate:quinone oxidoreductase n=1 Tax=Prochlorococcus marinus XMU1408 TaxID=2213228 RepID=A0A318RI44_PROMR|nr:malate:quinone oxidoreductase [Prochlorococcus marinus]MBW3041446.1 malate:quinone oxidoreductase [Prochlorococcus marinus str. XMU1408]PYE03263.1 malate:quinone oxidoreductase [Prochlorococcus marinus XMU1408]
MFRTSTSDLENTYDAILVGAGIMSSTLAVLLHELDPDLRLLIVERLSSSGLESSSANNNAGTGHAANCELNYTPVQDDGCISTSKAFEINKSFEQSLEFWASLAEKGKLIPATFLNKLPHISLVFGNEDIHLLQKRFSELSSHAAFSQMEFTKDHDELKDWIPLVMDGRKQSEKIAATRIRRGTDIDFGNLTRSYIKQIEGKESIEINYSTNVENLQQDSEGVWYLSLDGTKINRIVRSKFVFLGAGGGALTLLQKSGIPEGLSYAGFPVSGKWLICEEENSTKTHNAKVYGNAAVGAPPMSVPHLDTRWINGKRSLLFGPFAGFSSNFLKYGSKLDLFRSIKSTNVVSMLQAGITNLDLGKYLFNQLIQTNKDRIETLKKFLPMVRPGDWKLSIAGQRVQIIKQTPKGGVLKMGTEVVTSSDGSLAVLLGASPGASTAVTIMIEVLNRCWYEKMKSIQWQKKMLELFPSIGTDINSNQEALLAIRKRNDFLLKLI